MENKKLDVTGIVLLAVYARQNRAVEQADTDTTDWLVSLD